MNIIYNFNYIIVFEHLVLRIFLQVDSKLEYMKKFGKIVLTTSIVFLVLTLMLVSAFFMYINFAKTDVTFNKEILEASNTSIDIYNMQNEKINKNYGKKALAKIDELPDYVPASFVSIEDKDFYNHHGLNYKRMIKAMLSNLKSRSFKEGASTISQQLIKNTHLTSEKTITRKLNEMALANKLEKNFSKDEIMEMYLNVIYFGNGAYGIENASQTYFGKPANKLTIGESAMLAGMIKSPSKYSPISHYETALSRRNLVLDEMKKDGQISDNQCNEEKNKPIELSLNTNQKLRNFYEEGALNEAIDILNLTESQIALGGYKIFTYQDKIDQNALEKTILDSDYYAENSYGNVADGCGTIIDAKTGGITAFAGKSVYDLLNMKRSPGSSLKPALVYASALETGIISPSSPILDEKKSFGAYSPQNVGGIYYGWIDATKSVEKSLNIPAIKILEANGIERSKRFAEKCGIKFDQNDTSLSLALGGMTKGTKVVELVNSYVPFANNGEFVKAKFVRKITDKNGKVIYQNNEERTKAMSEETAYLMTEMLISGVKKGTSSRLNSLPFQIAGKTGTVGIKGTNLNSDVWSVAYTPEKVVGVWLGNSTGEKEYMLEGSNNGGTYCTSIVRDTIKNINIDKSLVFKKPRGVVTYTIDNNMFEKEHVLRIANADTPERYTKTADFNIKFAPTIVAEKYMRENFCTLSHSLDDNKVELYFNAIRNATYKLYRIEEDQTKLLKTFENVAGKQTYTDKSLEIDVPYTYYVEVLQDDEKPIKSNNIKVMLTPKQSSVKRILNYW